MTTLDPNSIITTPGKFEGQRLAVSMAYNLYLDGMALDDDGEVVTVDVPVEHRPCGDKTIPSRWETIKFIETEQGFVEEVR